MNTHPQAPGGRTPRLTVAQRAVEAAASQIERTVAELLKERPELREAVASRLLEIVAALRQRRDLTELRTRAEAERWERG